MKQIKIMIVDDHPMIREALQMAFTGEADLKVVAEASDGVKALKLLKTLSPDVILMDLLMPEMSGVETIEKIFEADPRAKILVISSMEDEDRVLAAIQAGALGYFPKTAPRQYLLEAVRKVADGIPYLPSGITLKLFQGLRHIKTGSSSETQVVLTKRQQEILALLAEGRSDKEIGKTLHLQESTVRTHVHSILQRMKLETRAQAVAFVHQKDKADKSLGSARL